MNWSYPRQSIFFSDGPPYTAGTPDPEFATRTNGTAKGAYYNIESYADAERGRLSVGVSGGVWRNADWSGGTFYSELPDRWLLGDAITASASILQVIDLPSTIPQGATVTAAAQFSWLPMYRDNWGAPYGGYIYNALQNIPGLHSAIGNGFVGVSVVASTRVSLFAGPTMAVSSETTLPVLLMAIDADSYGDVPDQVPAPYLFFDFAFAGNPWAIEELAVTVPTVNDGTHIIVDTTVRLMGARCGVNDPDGGSVAAAFQDLYDPASPVSDVPTSPNPFVVNRITAWSTSD